MSEKHNSNAPGNEASLEKEIFEAIMHGTPNICSPRFEPEKFEIPLTNMSCEGREWLYKRLDEEMLDAIEEREACMVRLHESACVLEKAEKDGKGIDEAYTKVCSQRNRLYEFDCFFRNIDRLREHIGRD